jgi:glycosyltransferase involved in cell wall biosynthesis
MKNVIVTTTINSPTKALIKYSQMPDWNLIVVGDMKTPHDEYKNIDCYYMSPREQEKKYTKLSGSIGWNCIQRRNLGFVEAYNQGADVVATVDDDNIPYDNWGVNLLVGTECMIDCWEAENGVFDPLSVTNINNLWHRGYPLSLIKTKNNIKYLGKTLRKVLVQADLWDGDPDIDAIARSVYQPEVKIDISSPFCSNVISPFNSQNTFISREVLPYYMMLPYVGRMDDIWGAYLIQKIFPHSIVYGLPTVYQERNPHDLIVDMEKEILGYRHTLDLLWGKYELPNETQNAYQIYQGEFK